jgi:hypothetical protein
MKIAAIRAAFAEEWVAVEVLRVDKSDVPLAGQVITHSPDKQEVYQAVKAYLEQRPTARTYIFFTGNPIPEGLGACLPSASWVRGRLACGTVLLVPVPVRVQRQDCELLVSTGTALHHSLMECW